MKKSELKELYQMMFPGYPDIVTTAQLMEMQLLYGPEAERGQEIVPLFRGQSVPSRQSLPIQSHI